MGTGPERARPRLLRRGCRSSRCARRQRKSQGANESSEPAAACANAGVEVLKRKKLGEQRTDQRRLDSGLGSILEAKLARLVGLIASRRFLRNGENWTTECKGFASSIPPNIHRTGS